MATVELDVTNYVDWGTGELPDETIAIWTEGLDLKVDFTELTNVFGAPTVTVTGSYADLVTLCGRYETDLEMFYDLIEEIVR